MKKYSYLSKSVYPLKWLDETVTQLANPLKTDRLPDEENVDSRLQNEIEKQKNLLNGLAFSTLKKRKIKRLFRHYFAMLSYFHRHTFIYGAGKDSHAAALHDRIGELLDFMELHFSTYLKKRTMEKEGTTDKPKRPNPYKLICALSQDQLGIILKSADDLRIIISRSLSNIFNQLAPYLSTPYKEDLSPDSMRSHTYSIEERDKQVAIDTLQRMIEKIREY